MCLRILSHMHLWFKNAFAFVWRFKWNVMCIKRVNARIYRGIRNYNHPYNVKRAKWNGEREREQDKRMSSCFSFNFGKEKEIILHIRQFHIIHGAFVFMIVRCRFVLCLFAVSWNWIECFFLFHSFFLPLFESCSSSFPACGFSFHCSTG